MTANRLARLGVDLRAWRPVGLVLAGLAAGPFAPADAAPAPAPAPVRQDTLHLRVLATHDFHGSLRPTTYSWSDGMPIGGAAALKAVMDTLEAACACPTVRVDGGDQMQGTLESNLGFGVPVVAAFNLIGLDAAAVGNHELDWGVDTLLARQGEAEYAWLAANVFEVETGERPPWARPFAIVERDGVRVAVIGYATVGTPRTLRADVTASLEFRPGYAGIRDALDEVTARRPDFVVVAAHAGGDCRPEGCGGEMVALASEVPPGRVHLIAGGHAHTGGQGVVNGIPIVRAGSNGRAVAVVDLYRLGDGTRAFGVSTETVAAAGVEPDPAMIALLAPHLEAARARADEPVTTLAEGLSDSPAGDRRLGNLIADAARLLANADVGIHNPGGVRAELPSGPVSYGDLHRVLPFDNAVVRLTLSGRQLRQLVEQAGPRYYYANLLVTYRDGPSPPGASATVLVGGTTPVRDDAAYTLAINDYLADGGDGLDMLRALPREVSGVTVLDALAAHLRALPAPVTLPVERRVVDGRRRP